MPVLEVMGNYTETPNVRGTLTGDFGQGGPRGPPNYTDSCHSSWLLTRGS